MGEERGREGSVKETGELKKIRKRGIITKGKEEKQRGEGSKKEGKRGEQVEQQKWWDKRRRRFKCWARGVRGWGKGRSWKSVKGGWARGKEERVKKEKGNG